MAADPAVATSFEDAVAVEPLGGGRYGAVVDGAWDGPVSANGGVLAAIMVRAAQAELGPEAPPPRTVSVQFLDAPGHGPVQIGVEILRRGKRVTVCDIRMRDPDRLVSQMTLVCSASRAQDGQLASGPPQAPPPEAVQPVQFRSAPGAPALFGRVETRPTVGSAPFSGPADAGTGGDAVTGGWLALRDDDAPLDAARLCALCDLWWPAVFGWLSAPAGAPTLQLTVYLRSTQPDVRGPVLARFETRNLQEGHIEERGELWSSEGRLLAESQQLALLVPLR